MLADGIEPDGAKPSTGTVLIVNDTIVLFGIFKFNHSVLHYSCVTLNSAILFYVIHVYLK